MKTKILLTAFIAFTLLAGCSKDNNGACGNGKANYLTFNISNPTFELFNGYNALEHGKIYYIYIGGATPRIQFFIASTIDNICPDEHMKVNYTIEFTTQSQPFAITAKAEAVWDIFLGNEEFILASGVPVPGFTTNKTLELGLKQVFEDLPGIVDVYNSVEFDSQGPFATDSAYFMNHVQYFAIESDYSKAL